MKLKIIFWIFAMFSLVSVVFAAAPTHNSPITQEVTGAETNLTGLNQTGADADGNIIIFNDAFHQKDGNGKFQKYTQRWHNDSDSLLFNWIADQDNVNDTAGLVSCEKVNTPDWITGGKVNGAYDFEDLDSDEVTCGDIGLQPTDTVTVMAWVKIEQFDADGLSPAIIQMGNTGFHFFDGATKRLTLHDPDVVQITSADISSLINVGEWHHFAVTFEGGAMTPLSKASFFVDGANISGNTDGGAPSPTYGAITRIGREPDGAAADYFDGYIDEVQVYRKVLSAAKINQTYNAGRFGHGVIGASNYSGIIANYIYETTPFNVRTNESGVTTNSSGVSVDTTPPEITLYNMTSEAGTGCTNWNTDKNNACTTTDTTPTVAINTSESANCRMGISDQNYTDLGASRNCSGTGTRKHTCTIIPQDELIIDGTSFVYIGCKDLTGNENKTSTSGALKVSLSLENTARVAMESGIQQALTSGYTIYTDQKVYARNSANQQAVGRFDKVVRWMSKIWAFNYLTGSDTYVNMSNITPVLYVLEMNASTNSTVNSTVYNLIISTK